MQLPEITFGVEIETSVPLAAQIQVGGYHSGNPCTQARAANSVALVSAPSFNGQYWKTECDGSILPMPRCQACEFVSPILKGEAGIAHLVEFVAFLNQIGAKVNSSCGLHIHVGLTRPTCDSEIQAQAKFIKILARLTERNAVALYAQTGTVTRETGSYCRRASVETRKAITKACRKANASLFVSAANRVANRYQLLNLTNVGTQKNTVEFRCFAGTLCIEKILCHLLSVLSLVIVAAGRKSLTSWDGAQLSGVDALHNLLKVRPSFSIVNSTTLNLRRRSILEKGFEMARKYDEAKGNQAAIRAAAHRNVLDVRPVPYAGTR